MTLIRHELRQNRIALAVWTAAVTGFIAVCTAMNNCNRFFTKVL